MMHDSNVMAARHLRICRAFGDQVELVGEGWHLQSPCSDWDARGVLEHVIGFHDVLLLRPFDVKPQRPKGDPVGRWTATADTLERLFKRRGLFDGVVEVPPVGNNPPSAIDAARLVPLLSLDVLVHTWDLARAAGHDVTLDPHLTELFLSKLPLGDTALTKTGMYDSPWDVPADADPQTRLLGRLGRNPHWNPSVL